MSRTARFALLAALCAVALIACDGGGYYDDGGTVFVHQHTVIHQHVHVHQHIVVRTPPRPVGRR